MNYQENIESLLQKISEFPIFEGIQGYQLRHVVQASWVIRYKAGQIIFEPKDYTTAFFIILSGAVRIKIHNHKTLELGPGRYFGEYSLIEKRPHEATAVALSDTELLIIPADVFNNLLQQSLPFSNSLLKTLIKRLKTFERLEYVLIEKNEQIQKQNLQIKEQNININESIEYSAIIQKSLFPSIKLLNLKFKNCFLIFEPYEKVSGDFYWFAQRYNEYCLAVADCTGHGIPAALISILGITYLNEIITGMQDPDPGKVLLQLKNKINSAFASCEDRFQGHFGLDIAIISINFETHSLRYAGANLPIILIRNNQIVEFSPQKVSLGSSFEIDNFTTQTFEIRPKDMIYMFSDGILDQIGNESQKRLGLSGLKKILIQVSSENIHQQKSQIVKTLKDWKGSQQQIDDITLLGIKI
ncbi:MAG TPA: SpoIIE family protein phosphatase [Salinivirgaceae bacterium]|nr:SpoIIE family protein phosphatase [Salinivirgaceae bacterium]